jgi:hypothetical protein
MLTDYAFITGKADLIFNFMFNFNESSQKICIKNGYTLTTDVVFDDPEENENSRHYILTKAKHKPYLTYEPHFAE